MHVLSFHKILTAVKRLKLKKNVHYDILEHHEMLNQHIQIQLTYQV